MFGTISIQRTFYNSNRKNISYNLCIENSTYKKKTIDLGTRINALSILHFLLLLIKCNF